MHLSSIAFIAIDQPFFRIFTSNLLVVFYLIFYLLFFTKKNNSYAKPCPVTIRAQMSSNSQTLCVFKIGDQVLVDQRDRAYIVSVCPVSEDDEDVSLSSSISEEGEDDDQQQHTKPPQIRFNIKYIVGGHVEHNVRYKRLTFSATNQHCQLRSGTDRSSSSTNPAPSSNQHSQPSTANQTPNSTDTTANSIQSYPIYNSLKDAMKLTTKWTVTSGVPNPLYEFLKNHRYVDRRQNGWLKRATPFYEPNVKKLNPQEQLLVNMMYSMLSGITPRRGTHHGWVTLMAYA